MKCEKGAAEMEKDYLVVGMGPQEKIEKIEKSENPVKAWLQVLVGEGKQGSGWKWKVFFFDGDNKFKPVMEAKGQEISWIDTECSYAGWRVDYLSSIDAERPYVLFRVNGTHFEGETFETEEQAFREVYRRYAQEVYGVYYDEEEKQRYAREVLEAEKQREKKEKCI